MTSLVAWLGVDSRGPSSMYVASDSRVSWGKSWKWDYARKVFASQKHPILMGYVGDVLFPSQILGQITDFIDSGLIRVDGVAPDIQMDRVTQIIKQSFGAYPEAAKRNFEVVYCTRENAGMASAFYLFTFGWKSLTGWYHGQPEIPSKSGIICLKGTGDKPVKKWHERWNHIESEKETSRAVFSAFCDALQSDEDRFSGGAPQLAGLYRIGAGQDIGTIYNGMQHLYGLPTFASMSLNAIQWRNSVFERCDGQTMTKLGDAQKHKRPKGLARG